MNSVSVRTPKGDILEVEYTQLLEKQVRDAYNLTTTFELPASLVASFIENELRSALLKLEPEDA